jgi:hypothetical protein
MWNKETWIFTSYLRNTQTSHIMKIHPLRIELFRVERRTDEQTDIKKLTDPFRNFANAPENNRDDSRTAYLVLSFRTIDTEDEIARRFRKVKKLTTNRHGVTTQKILNFSNTAVRTYSLTTTVRPSHGLHLPTSRQGKFSGFTTNVFRKII